MRRLRTRSRDSAVDRRRTPPWLPGAVVLGAFVTLALLERRYPLRRSVEPPLRHDARNLAVAAASAAAVRLAENPIVEPLARLVERRGWGVLPRVGLPRALETALALALLDYTLYLWHVLTHRVPFLWRFHLVHHVDRDLTASTALRFHFVEMILSVPWRAAQVAAIGVGPEALRLWQTATLVEILFHHSNLRLPPALERRIGAVVVTPRMHGIHHSSRRDERDANWSSGLTIWDRLHGTLRRDVPQSAITIGVAGCCAPDDLALPRLLALPFRRNELPLAAD
jgi:sterol desaturase/sphingolipid hydroxylase (fatty acid hydroxylase superfamily)